MDSERHHGIDRAIVAACVAGIGAMSYLTYLHFHSGGSTLCDLSPGFNCQIVNQSIYSSIAGVPVSLLGITYFIGVILLVTKRPAQYHYRLVKLFTLFGLVFSLYLSGMEYFWLGTVCLFCEFSKVMMAAIGGLAIVGMRKRGEPIHVPMLAGALLAGLLFTGAAWLLQR